jgi:CO/xanthine dehydrogenase Mo-binding subunit
MTTTATTTGTSVFSTNETRLDGHRKVSGREKYAADVKRPNMLHAAFVASPHAYARIKHIDTAAAKAFPGVRAVLTSADIGRKRFGRNLYDWPVLAFDTVSYIGDRVVAIAADTRHAAEEAAKLVEVEYEELEPMLTASAAIRDTAPAIHPEWASYRYLEYADKPRPRYDHPNIHGEDVIRRGRDVKAALASAYRVFEHRFSTPHQHCGYIEPHATLVWIDDDGTVHCHSPNKSPYSLRLQLATVAEIPLEKIIVESTAIGGDYGGKGFTIDDFPVYFLAKATGRPVRYVETWAEELGANHSRHTAEFVLRSGVDRDGRLLAFEAEALYAGGAYCGARVAAPLLSAGHCFCDVPYWVPEVEIRIRGVYTNTVPGAHVRIPGDTQAAWALEQHLDMIATELGIDPLEMRRRNLVKDDQPMLRGEHVVDARPISLAVLDALEHALPSNDRLPRNRGRGYSFTCRDAGPGKTSLRLQLQADGTFDLITGVPDQGAGNQTTLGRIAAAALGVEPARIRVRRGSTAEAPPDPGAGAGRVTNVTGGAAKDAAEKMRALLQERSGRAVDEQSIAAIARDVAAAGAVEVIGTNEAGWQAKNYSFSAYGFEVDVDRETGMYRVTDVVFVTDVGTVINPVTHQGQIDGGFMCGYGCSCMEDQAMDESGKITALSFADYKIPTMADIPPFRTVLVEGWLGTGPYGAKQVGEIATAGVPAALGNAIANAVGVRVERFPITSENVYEALQSGMSSTV